MSLNIGVALLTYSRPAHTRRVLEGLRREGVQAFTVYMDGEGMRDRLIEQELEKLRRQRKP